MKIKNVIYLLCSIILLSCEQEMDGYIPASGEADFSTMIAVGNSLTAGFADGELYKSAQLNSFPNIMAQQIQNVGGGEFKQPLMKNEYGFGNRLILGSFNGNLLPVPYGDSEVQENRGSIYEEKGPFNNFGVPGAKTDHLIASGYGTLNDYFGRFAKNINTSSILEDALAVNPTFFLLWIGNNDILSFAISGGEGETITDLKYYSNIMTIVLDQLISDITKGAIANIPEVTGAPFFTTLPSKGLFLSAEGADALNIEYADLPHIEFEEGLNGFVVKDFSAPGNMRQLKENELLLLTTPQDSLFNAGWGSEKPILPEFYLSEDQIDDINTAVKEYNNFIEEVAENNDLAYVDINSLLKEANTGMCIDGVCFSSQFITGGLFSLDGIHLTARGNAIIANAFIESINKKYNSSIPKVSVTDYPGIIYP